MYTGTRLGQYTWTGGAARLSSSAEQFRGRPSAHTRTDLQRGLVVPHSLQPWVASGCPTKPGTFLCRGRPVRGDEKCGHVRHDSKRHRAGFGRVERRFDPAERFFLLRQVQPRPLPRITERQKTSPAHEALEVHREPAKTGRGGGQAKQNVPRSLRRRKSLRDSATPDPQFCACFRYDKAKSGTWGPRYGYLSPPSVCNSVLRRRLRAPRHWCDMEVSGQKGPLFCSGVPSDSLSAPPTRRRTES